MNQFNEIRATVSDLFSPKKSSDITHGAIGTELKQTAKIASHGAKAIGKKLKRAHRVSQAKRAVKKRLRTTGMRQRQALSASFIQPSDLLMEFVSKIKHKVKRYQAGKSVMRKLTTDKLRKMDKQRTRIKHEKGVMKKIRKGRHSGEIVAHGS